MPEAPASPPGSGSLIATQQQGQQVRRSSSAREE
jgi:hypothetical protein